MHCCISHDWVEHCWLRVLFQLLSYLYFVLSFVSGHCVLRDDACWLIALFFSEPVHVFGFCSRVRVVAWQLFSTRAIACGSSENLELGPLVLLLPLILSCVTQRVWQHLKKSNICQPNAILAYVQAFQAPRISTMLDMCGVLCHRGSSLNLWMVWWYMDSLKHRSRAAGSKEVPFHVDAVENTFECIMKAPNTSYRGCACLSPRNSGASCSLWPLCCHKWLLLQNRSCGSEEIRKAWDKHYLRFMLHMKSCCRRPHLAAPWWGWPRMSALTLWLLKKDRLDVHSSWRGLALLQFNQSVALHVDMLHCM